MRPRLLVPTILLLAAPASAQDVHPAMESRWWVNAGTYLAQRDFKASASAAIVGQTRDFDLEGSLGLDDNPSLFMGELGWQFGKN